MRVAYLPQRDEPAVFFACRTRNEERYWRMVSQSGAILHCEYLLMVRLIDPQEEPGRPIHYGLDLKQLFAAEAIDTCKLSTRYLILQRGFRPCLQVRDGR